MSNKPLAVLQHSRLNKSKSFGESVVGLIFHILGSAVLFVAIVGVAWLLGMIVHFLNLTHPFDPAVLNVIHKVELGLVYVDMFLSGMVLFLGAYRFIRELGGLE
jgi:hypothetical protein